MSEVTTLSADPFQQLVDHGFPLYRFREKTRTIKVLEETQVISRNNDYKPTPFTTKNHISVAEITRQVRDLGQEFIKPLTNIVWQDIHDLRSLEELDPLKGNSLIVTDDTTDTEIAIFSAGPSSSNLGVAIISTDKVTIIETLGLEYPIRQIQLSPLSNAHTKIILIRTTSSIHLIHLDQDRKIIPMHRLFLPDFSDINRKVDYSMPIHAEPSPFYNDQYLFTTNNGYTALMDATNNEVLFEDFDPISQDTPYKSRWRSCGFGKTPFTIYTVTPDCLKEFVIRHDYITSKVLAIPNERIVAFQTTQHSLYCFATTTSIAVMDRMYPERPIVTWLHRMRDGPPTDILIDRLLDDKWRITAFSKHTQRYTMISLHYINSPTQNSKPIIKILELFNFILPVNKFEEIFNYKSRINTVGCSIRTQSQSEHDTTQGNLVLSVYRSFEDGSMRVNYIKLASDHDDETTFTVRRPTTYTVVSQSESFDQLMSKLAQDLLPDRKPTHRSSETLKVDITKIKEYVASIEPGSRPLEDAFKRKIAEKVQDLTSTCTFRDLFEDEEYQEYKLQDLNDFLDQMELHEEIERGRQIDTFGIYHLGQPTDTEQHQRLKQAHEKEIHLASVLIRPLRADDTKFRYLDTVAAYNFQSTTTTKLFADLWPINDTRYDQVEFPTYTPTKLLQPEQFPSVNIFDRLGSPEPFLSVPDLPLSVPVSSSSSSATMAKRKKEEERKHDFSNISTQPLPGVFGSRTKKPTKKPVKKKSKTSGFK